MKLNRSSMLYGTLILTGTSIISQLLGFLYRILLSRLIGAEVMGLYQLIMPVYSVIMAITAVGLTVAVSNLSSEFHAHGNRAAIRQVLRRALVAFFVIFALVAAVTVLCYDPISVYLLGDARTQLGLLLLLPCILLTGIENLHKHYFYGTGNIRPPAAVELCEQFIRTGAVLGLLVVFLPQNPERTVGLIVVGMICCEIFSSATLAGLFRRHMRRCDGLPGPGVEGRALNRRMASIALPIGATALLGNLMGSANAVLIPQRLVASGVGLRGYVAGFVASSALGVLLNWRQVHKATGLRPQIFQWCTAPALAALLMGLCDNLLYRVLLGAGLDGHYAVPACLLFGAVLYLAALSAQGINPFRLFRLSK